MCDPLTLGLGFATLIGNKPQKPPKIEQEVETGGELEAARENTGAEVALGDDRSDDILTIDPLSRSNKNDKKTAGTGLSTGTYSGLNIL